jgi:hypothetical protein
LYSNFSSPISRLSGLIFTNVLFVDTMTSYKVIIPIKIVSESNNTDHWTVKSKRHKAHKKAVLLYVPRITIKQQKAIVTLTRFGMRRLDDDNLVGALKWIRDAVADRLIPGLNPGMADSDPRITWQYRQQTGKIYALEIKTQFLPLHDTPLLGTPQCTALGNSSAL